MITTHGDPQQCDGGPKFVDHDGNPCTKRPTVKLAVEWLGSPTLHFCHDCDMWFQAFYPDDFTVTATTTITNGGPS